MPGNLPWITLARRFHIRSEEKAFPKFQLMDTGMRKRNSYPGALRKGSCGHHNCCLLSLPDDRASSKSTGFMLRLLKDAGEKGANWTRSSPGQDSIPGLNHHQVMQLRNQTHPELASRVWKTQWSVLKDKMHWLRVHKRDDLLTQSSHRFEAKPPPRPRL